MVNVTDVAEVGIDPFEIVQMPTDDVRHVTLPVAPALHVPLTVARATDAWFASSTRIVTRAVQVLPFTELDPSRSPTWIEFGSGADVTVIATDPVSVPPAPSLTV
jgi:hypothetical protein